MYLNTNESVVGTGCAGGSVEKWWVNSGVAGDEKNFVVKTGRGG
jgi:hypothetical protein